MFHHFLHNVLLSQQSQIKSSTNSHSATAVNVAQGHNKAWSDKDMTERCVFVAAFPQAKLHLCMFHTLRSFSREVTQEKLGVKTGARDALLVVILYWLCIIGSCQNSRA